MRRLAITNFLAIIGFSCAVAAYPFRSAESARASELADALDRDPIAFETNRAPLDSNPQIAAAFCRELCRRILAIEEERRRREATIDPTERERSSQLAARYRSVIPTLGEPAAAVLVDLIRGAGYEVSLSAELLAKMEDKIAEPSIEAAVQSADANVRRGALRAAATSPSRIVHFQETATQLLNDPQWIVRREAASLLGQSKLSGAKWDDALSNALTDSQMLVAREAARALGRRQAIAKIPAIIEFLERGRTAGDPGAVESAITALNDITNRRDIEPDPVAWRRWLEQNAPPASSPNVKN